MSNSKEVSVVYTVGDEEIRLTPTIVKDYLAGGAAITLPEFKMFTSLCKARGLNPFLKEAYIIKFGNNPAQIVVGKDAILKRAILNKAFDGREQGVIVVGEDGLPVEKNGTFTLASETIVGGWAKVYRKDWEHPVYITVSLSEVGQKKRDGSLNMNWATKTGTMIEKVALVRALREAFVDDMGGMYDQDELPEETIVHDDATIEKEDSIKDQEDTLPVIDAEVVEDSDVIDLDSL